MEYFATSINACTQCGAEFTIAQKMELNENRRQEMTQSQGERAKG